MKKVIYIGYVPITKKFYSDYYLGVCIENGLEVEYWDMSRIYFPKINFDASYDFAGAKHVKSFRELKALLSSVEMKSTIFIVTVTYELKVLRLFMLLSSFKCTLAFFGRGMLPAPEKAMALKVRETFLSLDFDRIIAALGKRISAILRYCKMVKLYDLVFMAGSEGYVTIGHGNSLDLNRARVINVNNPDYDKYLDSIKGDPVIGIKYCVFLDEYFPYHSDGAMIGLRSVAAEHYYPYLNKFFDFVEKKTGVSVIIAAHPRAVRYKTENPFAGRTIVFDKTCELVRDAEFVMTHHSTSISFPVSFKKPILFITSQAQKKAMPLLYEMTLCLARFLNCQVIHFDGLDGNEEPRLSVDTEKYDTYKYRYLTSKESENRQSSGIFIETITGL